MAKKHKQEAQCAQKGGGAQWYMRVQRVKSENPDFLSLICHFDYPQSIEHEEIPKKD